MRMVTKKKIQNLEFYIKNQIGMEWLKIIDM